MATRTPQRGPGGEAADTKRKERRHGKGELSPKLKGALKSGAKTAAEELLMSVIPVARMGKLAKLLKGFGKGKKAPKKGELKSMLEQRGFKKLASVDPTLNELEVFLRKRAPKGMEDEVIKISGREGGEKSLKAIRREAKELAEEGDPGQFDLELGSNMLTQGMKEGSVPLKERGKAMLRKSDRKKALAKMVREDAAKRKKAVRKAAEAKVTRRDGPPFDTIKGITGYSGYTMGAGAKKLDAIPGLEYIDPRDSFPLARDTLAFLKSHHGTADYRLVKHNGKTKAMAVEVEGIHYVGDNVPAGTKEVHIFDLGEKNAKRWLGY